MNRVCMVFILYIPYMAKRLNTEEFVRRSINIHGDKYDYSKVKYVNNKTKVEIICKIHGSFHQLPITHINNKSGCPKCYGNLKLSTGEFVRRSINIHGDKYDYSKVKYVNNKTEVVINCKIHGDFNQLAYIHLNGHGCFKCANGNDLNTFIMKSKKIYGNKYNYSKSIYIDSSTPIEIICKIHGSFFVTPSYFLLSGNGCNYCTNNSYKNLDFFKKEANFAHNNKYDYEIIDNLNKSSYINVICPIHGKFRQKISSHISEGHGCRKCVYDSMVIPFSEILTKFIHIHGNKYDYSKIEYKNTITSIEIICKIHGSFHQLPKSHLRGDGCPNCHMSKGESKIKKVLENNQIKIISQKTFDSCLFKSKLKFDFYLPDYNMCIEYDGEQHFIPNDFFGGITEFKLLKQRDKIKDDCCRDNKIKLLRIPYWDLNNIEEIISKELNKY